MLPGLSTFRKHGLGTMFSGLSTSRKRGYETMFLVCLTSENFSTTLFGYFRFIHSTNRKNLNYKLSANHMTDVDDKEYIRYRGSKEDSQYTDHHSNGSLINDEGAFNISGVPDSLDWRDFGKFTAVVCILNFRR